MVRFLVILVRLIGINPKRIFHSLLGFPVFFRDWIKYSKSSAGKGKFPIRLLDLYPVYPDRFDTAGVASGHYFHQDLWAARRIYIAQPEHHVDIGSRVDGFISHLLVFRNVTVVDVRPLESRVPGLTFEQGDVTKLAYDDESLESVSCLHAIEHVGLGRYGDKIDYNGWLKGLRELQRILRKDGILYLGVPIGRERVCYNAHRVFSPRTICESLPQLSLEDFSYVDDHGNFHEGSHNLENLPAMEYGCGLFEFRKLGY